MYNSALENLRPCVKIQPIWLLVPYLRYRCYQENQIDCTSHFRMLRHLVFLFLLLASQCTSFVIHPNCRAFEDFPANTQSEIHKIP